MAASPHAVLAGMKDVDDIPPRTTLPPRAGLLRRLAPWLFREREDARVVRRLSDHLLRDIGLSRPQAHDMFDRRRDPRF